MKKGDKFQINYQWWDKERPKLLPSTGLGASFKAYETAKRAFQTALTMETHQAAVAALEDVESARVKAVKLCGPAFQTEKAIFVAGEKVVISERHKLDELGRARAKVHAQKIVDTIDEHIKTMRALERSCEEAESFLIKAREKDDLEESEKKKLGKALGKISEIVYSIEDIRSRVINIDKKLECKNSIYFDVKPSVLQARRDGMGDSTSREVTEELRNLAKAVGSQHGIAIAFKSHQ